MQRPLIGTEMSRAYAEGRRAEAVRDGLSRRRRLAAHEVWRRSVRLSPGSRLVSTTHRPTADAVEVV